MVRRLRKASHWKKGQSPCGSLIRVAGTHGLMALHRTLDSPLFDIFSCI